MSSGQQLLVLGAIILFSIFILGIFTTENVNTKTTITNAAIITATGVAQNLLEQIQTEAFDSATVSKAVSTPNSLTPPSSLGPDPGETSVTKFNDIDDYNGYTEIDTIGTVALGGIFSIFNVKAQVSYCTKMNPDVPSSVSTFSKKIDISVYNKYLIDTLKLSKVISYY